MNVLARLQREQGVRGMVAHVGFHGHHPARWKSSSWEMSFAPSFAQVSRPAADSSQTPTNSQSGEVMASLILSGPCE